MYQESRPVIRRMGCQGKPRSPRSAMSRSGLEMTDQRRGGTPAPTRRKAYTSGPPSVTSPSAMMDANSLITLNGLRTAWRNSSIRCCSASRRGCGAGVSKTSGRHGRLRAGPGRDWKISLHDERSDSGEAVVVIDRYLSGAAEFDGIGNKLIGRYIGLTLCPELVGGKVIGAFGV